MKVIEYDNTVQRCVIADLITDKNVLARVAPRWTREGLFDSPYLNLIGKWCVDHLRKYGVAPGRDIERWFQYWKNRNPKDDANSDMVERLLVGLSDEFGSKRKRNSEYGVDLAAKYFKEVALRKLNADIGAAIEVGRIDHAEELRSQFKPLDFGTGAGFDPFSDRAALAAAFAEDRMEGLVPYDGALREFFQGALCRNCFVAVTGIDKSGKSFLALDIAFRAARSGRRVAYFECGDLSQDDIMRRLASRQARQPEEPGDVYVPDEIAAPEEGQPGPAKVKGHVESKAVLNLKGAERAFDNFIKGRDGESVFRLHVHNNSTVSAAEIRNHVDSLAQADWVPDVVVIDYSDILAPPPGVKFDQARDATDATWRQMRAISQEFHCLVVTPTQSDADGYKAKILTRKNFSGDKRKNAHVTSNLGINMTAAEKDVGVMRLNWIVRRRGQFNSGRCLHVAGCLAIANPCMAATF